MERIGKCSINNFSCHPEIAALLVADVKGAYKGWYSQSNSGSCHRQKCSAICTQKSNVGLKAQPTSRRIVFTLAEVLITLGIIGIVAAMTMPMLIAKYQKKVLVTKMKYVYTLVSNAMLQSQADNGSPKEWEWGNSYNDENLERVMQTYILPYIKGVETKTIEEDGRDYYYIRLKNGMSLVFTLDGITNHAGIRTVKIYRKITGLTAAH